MSSQTVKYEYDAQMNILFTEDDYSVATEQDVEEFLSQYQKKLEEIGRKVYIVSRIDGLEIHAKLYEDYGKKIKAFIEKWCLGLARWGANPLSRMTVRAASVTSKFAVNIYNTREEAITAIVYMKKLD